MAAENSESFSRCCFGLLNYGVHGVNYGPHNLLYQERLLKSPAVGTAFFTTNVPATQQHG